MRSKNAYQNEVNGKLCTKNYKGFFTGHPVYTENFAYTRVTYDKTMKNTDECHKRADCTNTEGKLLDEFHSNSSISKVRSCYENI